jgi:hypothetical protein
LDRSDRRGGSGGGKTALLTEAAAELFPTTTLLLGSGAGGLVDFDGVDGPVGVCEGRGVVLDKGAAGGCLEAQEPEDQTLPAQSPQNVVSKT